MTPENEAACIESAERLIAMALAQLESALGVRVLAVELPCVETTVLSDARPRYERSVSLRLEPLMSPFWTAPEAHEIGA